MTEIVVFKTDAETKSKLEMLSEGSDKSKLLRALVLREWDARNDSIRVPVLGKLSKLNPCNEIENRQEGEE